MDKRQKEVVIVSAARTPIGKHGGYYNYLPAEDLAVLAVYEAILRSGISLQEVKIDQVIAGMIYIDSRNQQIYLPRNVAVRVAEKFNDRENLSVAPGKPLSGSAEQVSRCWPTVTTRSCRPRPKPAVFLHSPLRTCPGPTLSTRGGGKETTFGTSKMAGSSIIFSRVSITTCSGPLCPEPPKCTERKLE
ncbi:MAG: hypothetical protein D4R97_02340 [Bacteroidetes bacterium]|nr:MAG: hypothetical protein D4R97_02340 [Bacteroidota bacterium]